MADRPGPRRDGTSPRQQGTNPRAQRDLAERLARVEAKLDTVLQLLRGGTHHTERQAPAEVVHDGDTGDIFLPGTGWVRRP